MERRMTARLGEIGSKAADTASSAPFIDDPVALFGPEPQQTNERSVDSTLRYKDAIQSREQSAQFATPNPRGANDRTAGVVNLVKRAFGLLDIARTVDIRVAALKSLEREVKDRAERLESLNQRILDGTERADYVVRLFESFDPRLATLKEKELGLRGIETTVAAFEDRAQTVSITLDRHMAASEAREALVAQAVEQLGRRAADTIDNFERHVGDCEARAHAAEETIAHLHDVSERTLPELQQRLKEADAQNQSIGQTITEAERMATALTALEQRLPDVGRCNQDLARIELAVPQIERQLEDLSASVERQTQALAVNQQLVRQTLDESQATAVIVSDLESRIVNLSRTPEQLDPIEECVGRLEARVATAASEFTEASHARDHLEQEIVTLEMQLRGMTKTADDDARKLVDLQHEAVRQQHEQALRTTAIVSGVESRLADISSGHQQLDRLEEQLGHLQQRATAAAGELQQVTNAKNGLEQEVIELHNQLSRLTEAAEDEAKKIVEIQYQSERYRSEQAHNASVVLSGLEHRIADVDKRHQQLLQFERQLERLEARLTAAGTEVRRSTDAKNDLEREATALQNRLRLMTKAADDDAQRLAALEEEAQRYQREETQKVSAVLSGLESRVAEIGKRHQQVDAAERHVEQLERRADLAAREVIRATRAKNELQHEIAKLHSQVERLTKAAQDETEKLDGVRQHAEGRAHDPLITLHLRRYTSSRPQWLSREHRIVGSVALALSAAIVLLVGSVWRTSRIDDERTANPPRRPALASFALPLMPMTAVAPLTPATIAIGSEDPGESRAAPVERPAPVAQVVASGTEVATGRTRNAGVREQSVGTESKPAQFVGTLLIESEPAGATAFLNQQSVGETPVLLKNVRIGSYVVRVEYEGYQRWSTAATVSAIREARIKATLQR